MLPQRIGRYDVSAELGRGATSIVYKGLDAAHRRIVAIKTLQRDGTEGSGDADAILQRFRHEARTIGRLRHPGVVAVHEFGEDGLHSWIAMEYVEGRNLDEVLVRSPLLGQARAVAIMDELLDALGCVHAHDICHRDLKPANIMVTPTGRVKLTDFGVARLRDLGLTRVSSAVGTPAFMAPEQFTGGALDPRADLFACGVLLYLLLSGRRPFSGAPAAVMHQILHEQPPSLSEASGGLVGRAFDGVIARALAKRADDRFGSAAEMRDALRAAAQQAEDSPVITILRTVVQDPDATVAYSLAGRALEPSPPDLDAQHGSGAGLPPEVRAAALQMLAQRLGPVAGVIVKRAADAAGGSRAAFVDGLLAQVQVADRAALQAELEGLLQTAGSGR